MCIDLFSKGLIKIKKILIYVLAVLTCLFSFYVSAHSGMTDSNGGHYDRQNGGYHYHHGYPAHEHTNGICPYENTEIDKSQEYNSFKKSAEKIFSLAFLYFFTLTPICILALGFIMLLFFPIELWRKIPDKWCLFIILAFMILLSVGFALLNAKTVVIICLVLIVISIFLGIIMHFINKN